MPNIFTLFMIIIGIIGTTVLNFDGDLWLGGILGWLIGEQWRLRQRLNMWEYRFAKLMAPPSVIPSIKSIEAPQSSESSELITTPLSPIQAELPHVQPVANFLWWLWSLVAGENPFVRIGVILVFLGVAFLFKHVTVGIEFSLEWRFIGTALGGLVLLGVGWRLREHRPDYAMVIQGGGIGVWYLTIFIAFRLGLVPVAVAFPLLIMIPIFSAILALGQDSSALALFGAAGGYLAPVLISSGGGSHVQLFSYYALLNAGVLGIAWFKAWRSLNLLGFIFTFVIGGIWGFFQYKPHYLYTTEPFLLLFFMMYVTIAVLFALRQPPRLKGLVDGSLVFGLPVVSAGLQAALVRHLEFGMAWSVLAMGGFYLGLSAWLWQREKDRLRLLCESFLALGVVFATLTIPLAVDGRWTAAAWSLEGSALLWIGARQGNFLARISGSLLQLIAGVVFSQSWLGTMGAIPVLNAYCLGSMLIGIAGIFSALQLDYHPTSLRPGERVVQGLLLTWGWLWWYGTGVHEIQQFVEPVAIRGVVLLFLTATAAAGIALRQPLASRLMAVPTGLLLPGMGGMLDFGNWLPRILFFLLFMFLLPFWGGLHNFIGYPYDFNGAIWPWMLRWIAWMLAVVVQYWGLRRLDGDFPNVRMRHLWHTGTLWILAWIVAAELSGLLAWWTDNISAWTIITWGLVPTGLAWWVMESGPNIAPWPFNDYRKVYLARGCGPLLIFAWCWAFYANITYDGTAIPLSYLPLLNPLDLTLAFVTLTLPRWWEAMAREYPQWTVTYHRKLTSAFAFGIFMLMNGVVARTVHHWSAIPYRWHPLFDSSTFQAALSLLWSTLALTVMVTAARRDWRRGWIIGAILLAVVVAKLFLIELANQGTLARIISFLGVGTLLLIIGYLAPLPRSVHDS